MARTLDQIRRDAMQLDVEERGALADCLAESFLTDEEREIQEEWIVEVERRLADYDAGRSKSVPFDEVMQKLREKYATKSRAPRRRGRQA
jgi:putative addiction module component (TIGR02574 family)